MLFFALGFLLFSASESIAQSALNKPKPWKPQPQDSVRIWGTRAIALLETSQNTQLGPAELEAYKLLNRIASNYFSKLGPQRMAGAGGLHSALDTLGLRIQITQDPELPQFALVQFLHPLSDLFASLAYLYWFRGEELLAQPINLKGGLNPKLSVFWVGAPEAPYEAGIVFRMGTGERRHPEYYLFRLAGDASVWLPTQVGERSVYLGGVGNADWVDLNLDGIPELLSWTEAEPDKLFKLCLGPDCPKFLVHRIFHWQRGGGFQLQEERVISTPFAVLHQFVLALQAGDTRLAGTLVTNPGLVQEGVALGWSQLKGEAAIEVFRDRSSGAWPDRIRISVPAPNSDKRVPIDVRFEQEPNQWLISEFKILVEPPTEGSPPTKESGGDSQ